MAAQTAASSLVVDKLPVVVATATRPKFLEKYDRCWLPITWIRKQKTRSLWKVNVKLYL